LTKTNGRNVRKTKVEQMWKKLMNVTQLLKEWRADEREKGIVVKIKSTSKKMFFEKLSGMWVKKR
jgi:hypothetical protein